MSRREWLGLAAVLLCSALLSSRLLIDGQPWGDDFASYLMQAQSLLDGAPQEFVRRNRFTIEASDYPVGPVAYPWGYPLLIAPVLALRGLEPLSVQILNVGLYLGFLVVFHRMLRRRSSARAALLLTAAFASNPSLLQAQTQILSDVAFLFVSTLALDRIDRVANEQVAAPEDRMDRRAVLRHGAIGLAIFAAFLVRVNGLLLFVASLAALWPERVERRSLRRAFASLGVCGGVFGALAALSAALLPTGFTSYARHFEEPAGYRWSDQLMTYLWMPGQIFGTIPFDGLFAAVAGVLFLSGVLSVRRSVRIHAIYWLATVALFSVWPQRQGLRFLYPVLPAMTLVAWVGAQRGMQRLPERASVVLRGIGTALLLGLVLLSVQVSLAAGSANLQRKRLVDGLFHPAQAPLLRFVRERTRPDDVIAYLKSRSLRLLTNRDAFVSNSCASLPRAKYLVIQKSLGHHSQLVDPSPCNDVRSTLVFDNLYQRIYRLRASQAGSRRGETKPWRTGAAGPPSG